MRHIYTPVLRLLLLAAFSLALLPGAEAKIWRVDNNGGSPGSFTSPQQANNSASVQPGDTLYVNGSGTGYGDFTLTKRLYVFGPGYFLAQNPETQASLSEAYVNFVRCNSGSAGSLITGMAMAYADINTNNILFKRNRVNRGCCGACITVGTGVSNISILQNYVWNSYFDRALYINGGCSNVIVKNNYLQGYSTGYDAVYSASAIELGQNVLYGRLELYSSTIYNNILRDGDTPGGSGNSYSNNICNGTQFPATNGNQRSVAMTNVFVASGTDDGRFTLKTGSVALAAGQNGEDCGIFGGNDPYVLSGLPAIPAIWFFSAPSSGSGASGLQIRLKAKSHN